MKFVPAIIITLFIGLLASCGDNVDCPDINMIGGNPNCPEDTAWACGCDDSTYINKCKANNRGIRVVFNGKCEDKPAEEE